MGVKVDFYHCYWTTVYFLGETTKDWTTTKNWNQISRRQPCHIQHPNAYPIAKNYCCKELRVTCG